MVESDLHVLVGKVGAISLCQVGFSGAYVWVGISFMETLDLPKWMAPGPVCSALWKRPMLPEEIWAVLFVVSHCHQIHPAE